MGIIISIATRILFFLHLFKLRNRKGIAVDKFFPEYLDKGSRGRAVVLLQLMLQFAGLNPKIVADGEYGEQTALAVRELQLNLGFTDVDVDGNFGPMTRRALREQRGIDINSITSDAFGKLN